MERITMKDLPKEQRPYEKCMAYGPKALTDSELLAVIIRTGSSERTSLELADAILSQNAPGDGLTGLLHCSLEQLQSIRGVGPVKGIQLLCIGELSRRIWKQEEIHVMFLNTKQHLIRDFLVSKGTVNASVVTPREILIEGLRCLAVGMVLVHNHPSGDPEPSRSDRLLTCRIREAGEVVGITLIDHLIIGDRRYLSFRREKLI